MTNTSRRPSNRATTCTLLRPEVELARRNFVSKVNETIFTDYFARRIYNDFLYNGLTSWVAQAVRYPWLEGKNLSFYVADDFGRCQKALEACAEILARFHNKQYSLEFEQLLQEIIQECGPELGLEWNRGRFSEAS